MKVKEITLICCQCKKCLAFRKNPNKKLKLCEIDEKSYFDKTLVQYGFYPVLGMAAMQARGGGGGYGPPGGRGGYGGGPPGRGGYGQGKGST